MQDLSPTERTRIRREVERAVTDRTALRALLDDAIVAHLGVVIDGVPHVVPTLVVADWDGPDPGGTAYVHGSTGADSLRNGPAGTVCLTVTLLDGLVLARSGFMHSVDYRSAMVYAIPRRVTDEAEREHALDLMVERAVPGRAAEIRRPTRKELAATQLLALSLAEASVKIRTGPPEDEPFDEDPAVWCGIIPLRTVAGDVVTGPGVTAEVPEHVRAHARRLGAG